MSKQSKEGSLKPSHKIESHRIFISIDSVHSVVSGLLIWKLGLFQPFIDSEDGSTWRTDVPDISIRKSEVSAKADIAIPEGETLEDIISEIKSAAWSIDEECSIHLTVFFLEKAPFTFYSFPAKVSDC